MGTICAVSMASTESPPPLYWLGNGQAIASVFVIVSTVMMYPSNINPSFDTQHSILIDIADTTITTFAYSWTDDLGRLPDVRSVPGATMSSHYGMDRLTKANASQVPQMVSPLLDFVSKFVPTEQHQYTRIKLFSTAPDRTAEQRTAQDAALALVNAFVTDEYGFQDVTTARVHASEKALLGWLALNQARGLLTNLLLASSGKDQPQSVGSIDLDGRSATIAFLPRHGTFYERTNVHSVLLGGSKLTVVTSELENTGSHAVQATLRENIDNTWGKQDPCLPTGARTSSAHVGTGKYVECAQAVSTAVGKVYKGNSEAFGKLLRETPFVATGLLALPHSFFNLTAKAPLAALDRVASSLCSDWDDQKIAASVLHEESVWTVDAQNTVTYVC